MVRQRRSQGALKVLASRLHTPDPAYPSSEGSEAGAGCPASTGPASPGAAAASTQQEIDDTADVRTALQEAGHRESDGLLICSADYYSYSLPLKQALTTQNGGKQREGLILRLTIGKRIGDGTGDEESGCEQLFDVCGEISPLPGSFREIKASSILHSNHASPEIDPYADPIFRCKSVHERVAIGFIYT